MTFLNPIIESIIPFTLLLGILVFVHEMGHFLVARACGVRVEVFSLGFGKKIFSFKKGDTVYCISLIPLGGYVKMFGEQPAEAKENVLSDEDKKVSFTHKTVWQRIAIVSAGPLMNFLFAILIFGFVSYTGEETRAARIAEVTENSVAAAAGLKPQDLILSVNGNNVRSFEEFQKQLNANQNSDVKLVVQQNSEASREISVAVKTISNPNIFSSQKMAGQIEGLLPYGKGTLVAVKYDSTAYRSGFKTGDEIIKINDTTLRNWTDLNQILAADKAVITVSRSIDKNKKNENVEIIFSNALTNKPKTVEDLGFEHPELYLEQVVPGSPAAKADLKPFDKIISINGVPMKVWGNVLNTIKSYDEKDALNVVVSREGTEILKKITPEMTSQMTVQGKEDKRFTVGILAMANISQPEIITIKEENIFAATAKGFNRSWDISVMTVMSFVRLFQGEVSHKNIGGLISIGKAAKDSYAMGAQTFLMTMGILSISLFILNLLPVPVLDGGHLVFYMIEIVKGSPLSMKKMELAHQIGFALLMGLMVLALFNDFTKFLFKS